MKSYWDMLPEDICRFIYEINHKAYMKDLIEEIKMRDAKHSLFEYYSCKMMNFWYIGVGIKSLQPEHWGKIKNHHMKYKLLYDSYKRLDMIKYMYN